MKSNWVGKGYPDVDEIKNFHNDDKATNILREKNVLWPCHRDQKF